MKLTPRIRLLALNTLTVVGAIAITAALAFAADHWLGLGLKRAVGGLFATNVQQSEPVMYVYDNRTGWRLNPLMQYRRLRQGPFLGMAGFEPLDTRLRVNSEGFIDREHYLETPYYRIAFVGNSWVEAVQHAFELRFSSLAEDFVFLQSEHRKAVEIMNFGTSNQAPAQSYGVIKNFVLKYKPDEVWLFIAANDLIANTPIDAAPPFGPTYEFAAGSQARLEDIRFGYVDPPAVAAFKRQRDLGSLLRPNGFREVVPYLYSEERNATFDRGWHDMRLSLELIARTLRNAGIRLRLVYLPAVWEADDERWAEYRRHAKKMLGREPAMDPNLSEHRFAGLARDLGIEFVSLLPLCRERGGREMHADHFTQAGHRWVAQHLAKIIIDTAPAKAEITLSGK